MNENKKVMPKSDLNRVDNMTDEDIDYSDIPPLTDEQLTAMKPLREVVPELVHQKTSLSIELDSDVVRWFKEQARGDDDGDYQSLINQVLRDYILSEKKPA